VHLLSIPTRVRNHNGGYTSDDRIIISRHMDSHEPMDVDDCIVLVDPQIRTTITNIVLCACSNFLTAGCESDNKVSSELTD
jgi:hypothetical protein